MNQIVSCVTGGLQQLLINVFIKRQTGRLVYPR